MSLSKPIIQFTDISGKKWDTYIKALVSNALQTDTYLDGYKLEAVVESITTHFYLRERAGKDETL